MEDNERCIHPDCIFRTTSNPTGEGQCDYLTRTGKSRIAGLPERMQLPCNCPYYEPSGKPIEATKNEDWRTRALRLYQAGATDGEIAAAVGVSRSRVQKWRYATLKKPANKDKKGPPVKIDYKRVSELYRKGYNDVRIADKLGCGQTIIFRWRTKNNLPPIRTHGRPG